MRRRNQRQGKREREAGKRSKRVWFVKKGNVEFHAHFRYFLCYPEAEAVPLKLGRKHARRLLRRSLMVADSRKSGGERALESAGRSLPASRS